MAVRPIVEYPAAVLLTLGDAVVSFDGKLESLVRDMFDTMYNDGGVGLAAQQIGLSLRLFVMDCDGMRLVAANPEIILPRVSKRARKVVCRSAKFTRTLNASKPKEELVTA